MIAPRLFSTVYVQRARMSNGDQFALRMLPADARELWLNLGVALGELPPLPNEEEIEETSAVGFLPADVGEGGEARPPLSNSGK